LLGLLLCAVLAALVAGAALERGSTSTAAEATTGNFGGQPLAFVPNEGQADPRVRFSAQAGGASFYFTRKEAVLAFARDDEGLALRLGFLGANPAPEIEGQGVSAGTMNYLAGSDASQWRTDIPTFGEVVYRDLWPGIDMVFRGASGTLKYEFVVAPGADPSLIGLAYRGADELALSSTGQLLIDTPFGTLRDEKPRTFQVVDGRRVAVDSRFALGETAGRYGFALVAYDPSRPLVIDPGLLYSTYLGGSGYDEGANMAVDPDGNVYVVGRTSSTNFPTSAGAFDPVSNGLDDAFVTKLSAEGSLAYSTYIGGAGFDRASGIAVDSGGNAYVVGSTESADFPTTTEAFDGAYDFNDAFATKLAPDGATLAYSTYLGSNGTHAMDVTVDATGSAIVVGYTSGAFPTTPGAFDDTLDGSTDGFVTKIAPTGSSLQYSTFLGGSECDLEQPVSVEVDANGNAYVVGMTSASSFPTTDGAFDTTFDTGCSLDGYLTKLSADGSGLVYSTYLGGDTGELDFALGVAVNGAGEAYVVGTTRSPGFPTTPGAFDRTPPTPGPTTGFLAKLDVAGSALVFSTYLGGSGGEDVAAIALDSVGDVFVSGGTSSDDFPTTPDAFDLSANGHQDAFVARFDPSASQLLYSTYLGGTDDDYALFGLHADDLGRVTFSGYAASPEFPTTPAAFDTSHNGGYDAYVAKLATEVTQRLAAERIGEAITMLESLTTPRNADKLEDVVEKLDKALAKLALTPPDRQGAAGELEGAVGDIEAAVSSRLLSRADGDAVMTEIAEAAGVLAEDAIADAQGGNAAKLAEAQAALAAGNSRLAAGRFKDAVAMYKDAISKAEGA
jgi:hypothetical protein